MGIGLVNTNLFSGDLCYRNMFIIKKNCPSHISSEILNLEKTRVHAIIRQFNLHERTKWRKAGKFCSLKAISHNVFIVLTILSVSYTHLDVYKRQVLNILI